MRVVVLKISDELYDELERRAKEDGIGIVGNYIIKLISKELKKEKVGASASEDLREMIEEMVEEILSEKVRNVQVPEEFEREIGEIVESLKEEIIEEVSKKMERKLQSLINPWTEKIDSLAKSIAELKEEIDVLKEEIKERGEQEERPREQREYRREEFKEHRRRRISAIDVLREQKMIFEDEIRSRMRNVDALFKKLESQGAKIIETKSGRVAVYPSAWEEFVSILSELRGSEDETIEELERLDPKYAKLFRMLRSEGLIYKDPSRGWVLEE